MDPARKKEYTDLMLGLVPANGENIGNVTLREQLRARVGQTGDELTEQDYWALRDALIEEGLIEQGRGRGGSVHRVLAPVAVAAPVAPAEPVIRPAEAALYEPFQAAITGGYVKENRIKRYIAEITAAQGRRATGGKWTRPDLTLAAVRTYQFTPGKRLEVITFEVKPSLDTAFEGVYEALAHSAFAHRTYLAVLIDGNLDEVPDDRIVQTCSRHGVGYLTFTNAGDYGTFDVVNSARLKDPDPYEVDNFVRTQLSSANQDSLRELLQ